MSLTACDAMTDLGRPYTGWPPGLLQDDCRALFDWFASRLDARERVRDVCGEQRVTQCRACAERA